MSLPLLGPPTITAVSDPSVQGQSRVGSVALAAALGAVLSQPLPAHGGVCALLSFAHQLACVTARASVCRTQAAVYQHLFSQMRTRDVPCLFCKKRNKMRRVGCSLSVEGSSVSLRRGQALVADVLGCLGHGVAQTLGQQPALCSSRSSPCSGRLWPGRSSRAAAAATHASQAGGLGASPSRGRGGCGAGTWEVVSILCSWPGRSPCLAFQHGDLSFPRGRLLSQPKVPFSLA